MIEALVQLSADPSPRDESKKSSKYPRTEYPIFNLRWVTNGSRKLQKTAAEGLRPNGRVRNWYVSPSYTKQKKSTIRRWK